MDPPKGLKSIGMMGLPGSEVREDSCEEEHLSRGLNLDSRGSNAGLGMWELEETSFNRADPEEYVQHNRWPPRPSTY